jgi:O-antigen/teichoic acid export membrane protein
MLVSFGLTVLNQVLQPHFSKLNLARETTKLQNLVNVSSLVIFIAAAIPALALVFFGDKFINFVYGNDYIMSLTALKILVIGQLANAAFGSVGALLNMTGNEKYAAKGMLIAVFVNIAMNFMFIPIWGIKGAAFSSAISLIIWNGMLRFYVKQQLGIESSGITNYLVKIFTFYRSN